MISVREVLLHTFQWPFVSTNNWIIPWNIEAFQTISQLFSLDFFCYDWPRLTDLKRHLLCSHSRVPSHRLRYSENFGILIFGKERLGNIHRNSSFIFISIRIQIIKFEIKSVCNYNYDHVLPSLTRYSQRKFSKRRASFRRVGQQVPPRQRNDQSSRGTFFPWGLGSFIRYA